MGLGKRRRRLSAVTCRPKLLLERTTEQSNATLAFFPIFVRGILVQYWTEGQTPNFLHVLERPNI